MSAIDLHLSAKGIGDAVCGYYAACGLASTGRDVVFHCHHVKWFRGVQHPGVTVVEYAGPVGLDMGGGDLGYLKQHYEAVDRKAWYCKLIADELGIEPFVPCAPDRVDREPQGQPAGQGGYVLMFPYCRYGSKKVRDWPAVQYAWLSRLLGQKKIAVAVSDHGDSPEHRQAARELFASTLPSADCYFDWHSAQTLDAILGAGCVVGNDSGMVHVAGMYGIPAIAIHSQFEAALLWSHTEVKSLMPETRCVACRFGHSKGSQFGKLCQDFGCAALGTVKAETVFDVVMGILEAR